MFASMAQSISFQNTYHIPANLGPNDNVNAWQRLYTEWLPTSGYELANLPCIENYLAPGDKIEQELWVPIIAK